MGEEGEGRVRGLQGAKLVDVVRRAGVSTGTVSNVLNRPDRVAASTAPSPRATPTWPRACGGGCCPA
ncbi:LacI family DNA-binding transcriptional regulator [Streptomyces sp. NPDC056411]|uniref:LacI family DNA-binding transcriptional regulator n=1 Tax=Streptomyces sp. NPDC056411 TaxID=3345813 RepID=UPI0035DA6A23